MLALEAFDLLDVEATAGHDLYVLEALAVERAAHQLTELRVDAPGVEVAHQLLHADVNHGFRRIQPHPPETIF